MKKLVLFLVAFFVATSAFADDCHLDKAIPISGNLLDQNLVLKNVTLDQAPIWLDPSYFDPSKDKMDVELFNIEYGNGSNSTIPKIDNLGADIIVEGKYYGELLGFFHIYGDEDWTFQGSVQTSGKSESFTTIYTTTHVEHYTKPQNADATTQVIATVTDEALVSVKLTFPIFTLHQGDGYQYVTFTGKNETVCVKSAH